MHAVSNVNQTDIHPTEPLVPELSAFEVEVAIEKLRRSPRTDQIPAELIKARHRTICSEISKLFNSIWNKEELREEWKESIIVLIYKKDDKIKSRLESGNACYHVVQNLLSSSLRSKHLKIKMYRTVILHIVLYGCKTWSLTLREERRLRVLENRVLRKIFEPKRNEVTGMEKTA